MKNQINLDTFGNTKACHALVKILNDPKKILAKDVNKILSIIEKITKHYKEASKLVESKSYFCALIKNDYISKIEFFIDHLSYDLVNSRIESLMKNINSYYCKKTITYVKQRNTRIG